MNSTNNDTNDVIGMSEFSHAYQAVHPYLALSICLTGIVMNVIFIIVLVQKQMRTVTNMLLVSIATSDFCLMTLYAIQTIMRIESMVNPDCVDPIDLASRHVQSYGKALYLLIQSDLLLTLYGISTWLTITLAILRHHMVSSQVPQIIPCKFALSFDIRVIVCVTMACIPIYICQGISDLELIRCSANETETKLLENYNVRESSFSHSHKSIPKFIALWINSIVFKLVPCVLLSVFITLIVLKMSQQNRKRKLLLGNQKQTPARPNMEKTETHLAVDINADATTLRPYGSTDDLGPRTCSSQPSNGKRHKEHSSRSTGHHSDRLNTILICILIVFLVCQFPQAIINFMAMIPGMNLNIYNQIGELLDDLSLISSCVNFFLYCSMSTQFRETFLKLCRSQFGCHRTRQEETVNQHILTNTNANNELTEHTQLQLFQQHDESCEILNID